MMRGPRYYRAVDKLADSIADLIERLAICGSWHQDVYDDIGVAFRTRHPNFDRDLRRVLEQLKSDGVFVTPDDWHKFAR